MGALENAFHRRVDVFEFGLVCAGARDQDHIPAGADRVQAMSDCLAHQTLGAIAPDGFADLFSGDEPKAVRVRVVRGSAQDEERMRPGLAVIPHALEIATTQTVSTVHKGGKTLAPSPQGTSAGVKDEG